jgi:hypothetical protein
MSYNPDSIFFKKGLQDALDNKPYYNELLHSDYDWGYMFVSAKNHRYHGFLNTSLLQQFPQEVQERYLVIFNQDDKSTIDEC